MYKKLYLFIICLISAVSLSAQTDSTKVTKKTAVDSLEIWKDYEVAEVVVKAMAPRVMVKGDTIQYNASQFKTPEGSVVEELVAKLPGAEIEDDGTIKINGKTVKKILVDGKEFMTGDTQTAMKNLPTSIIDKIKTYDQKSDQARITGIEDGEEETVLDFGIKRGMNKGTMINADLAIGTKDRFAERLFGGIFKDTNKFMLMANANNTNDQGFSGGGAGRRGFGGGGGGDNITKMIGANYNLDIKNFKMDASLRWNHSDGFTHTESWTESFSARDGKYSDSDNRNHSRSNSWNGQLRLEWTPWENTNIMFRPSFSYSTNDSRSSGLSSQYNVKDALNSDPVNDKQNNGLNYSESNNWRGMLQINQKLSNNGRNINLQLNAGYTDSESQQMTANEVHLYKVMSQLDPANDSIYHTYRYNLTPQKRYNFSAQVSYNEPLADRVYLQFSYKYSYNFNKSDRSSFDFSKAMMRGSNVGVDYSNIIPEYRNWGAYLDQLAGSYYDYKEDSLSRYSEYRNYIHDFNLTFRVVRDNYQLNAGILFQPQQTRFAQDVWISSQKQDIWVDTTRTVFNISPTVDFRYNFSKQHRLRLSYRGSTSQPSMSDLLDVTDNSDPLRITKGNPGLKPSFTQSLNAFYNNYISNHQQAIMANVRFNTTRNSISNAVTYLDDGSGAQVTRPENINGNWDFNAGAMYNTSIDSAGVWFTNVNLDYGFNNRVAFLQVDPSSSSVKNTTRTTNISPRIGLGFRGDWFEVELNGSLRYAHTNNLLQSRNNMDTKDWRFGTNIQINAPWGTSLTTNLTYQMRRGYLSDEMNTKELLWNAQISQSFLKNRSLVVSLQLYDILHQQTNISRTISAMQQSERRTNSVMSYGMLHVTYRFNAFGGRQQNRRPNGPGMDGPGEGRGNRGNGGGFGGGGFGGGGFSGGGFGGGRPM